MNRRAAVHLIPIALLLAACRPPAPDPPSAGAPADAAFRAVVEAALPAVVHIQVEARPAVPVPGGGPPGMPDLPELPDLGSTRQTPPGDPQVGAGSGVILNRDGYILTADHVVQQANRVTVTLHDRRQFDAEVIARDPSTDIAVLKIESDDLPASSLGDSDALGMGDWVLALGSPLGLQFSVTAGVVSAKGRAIGILGGPGDAMRSAPLEHFIQTDAAINPGNSGGPLVNLAGEVVGINSAIASPTGLFFGYGFAVPINLARRVADELIRYGEVRRAFLGVLLDEVGPADAKVYGLPTTEGAEVVHVQEDGPAAESGLEIGDVIVGIDDRDVESINDLQAALAAMDPGATATLHVIRFGESVEIPIRLGVIRSGITPDPPPPIEAPAGIGFGVDERNGALVISAVRPYSRAFRAGIRPGQVVLAVNRLEVRTTADLADALDTIDDDVISVMVRDPQIGRRIINYEVRP